MASTRRVFLQQISTAVAAYSSGAFSPASLAAQAGKGGSTTSVTRVYVDTRRTIAPIDKFLFGSFLEHLGRAIYEGIYQPGSSLSDAGGYRKDVLELVRQMGVPMVPPASVGVLGASAKDRSEVGALANVSLAEALEEVGELRVGLQLAGRGGSGAKPPS